MYFAAGTAHKLYWSEIDYKRCTFLGLGYLKNYARCRSEPTRVRKPAATTVHEGHNRRHTLHHAVKFQQNRFQGLHVGELIHALNSSGCCTVVLVNVVDDAALRRPTIVRRCRVSLNASYR